MQTTRRSVLGAGATALVALTSNVSVGHEKATDTAASAAEDRNGPQAARSVADVALFRDATEALFAIAERRRTADPGAPWVPRRHFVKNADEAHQIAFEGPSPIVGMSLDDLLDCSRSSHPNAGQLAAFCGVHRGFLHLIAAPDVKSIAALRGRRVAVDTDTGYASALFEMLRRTGLDRCCDFSVVYAGATNLRYEKLLRGAFDATLLGAPFSRLARRQGYRSLGTVIDTLGGYQAVVLVARRPWLAENEQMARAIVACLRTTLDWASRPDNRTKLETYLGELLGLAQPAASEVAQDLFGPASEFLPDGRMRDADTRVVIDLFNASRGASLTREAIAKLTDLSFLDLPGRANPQ